MKLKPTLDSLTGLDESLHSLYVQKNGKFVLDLDGVPEGLTEKGKVDEFRNNNIELTRRLEELTKNGLTLTPEQKEEYDKLMEEKTKHTEGKLISEGKIEELVQTRTENMRREFDTKYKALEKTHNEILSKYEGATTQLGQVMIESELVKNISDVGSIRSGAMTDILNRARSTFKVEDGRLVARNGQDMVYGKDGKTPLSISEWTSELAQTAPYLFEGSSGSGANGNEKGNDQQRNSNTKRISGDDNKAFIGNLEDIATGKVEVAPRSDT